MLLGINSDPTPSKLRTVLNKEQIAWPVIFDGGGTDGPVATDWRVQGWPTLYVIDAEGRIRLIGPRDEALTRAVTTLVEEAKSRRR